MLKIVQMCIKKVGSIAELLIGMLPLKKTEYLGRYTYTQLVYFLHMWLHGSKSCNLYEHLHSVERNALLHETNVSRFLFYRYIDFGSAKCWCLLQYLNYIFVSPVSDQQKQDIDGITFPVSLAAAETFHFVL